MFFMCPRREGCTLTVSVRPKRSELSETSRANEQKVNSQPSGETANLVVAALRILVGSTSPDCIPSKVFIEGRPVELTPGVKKWYSLPLTEEEIALSVRNGLVAVGIGQSFDPSNNPLVDSIEVYAAERQMIEKWLPKRFYGLDNSRDQSFYRQVRPMDASKSESPNGLMMSVRALAYLGELLGCNKMMSESERTFLKLLVQDTALDREKDIRGCVESLLEQLEPDTRTRKSFYDESILIGCSKALNNSKTIAEQCKAHDETEDNSNPNARWIAVHDLLHDCSSAATAIARERPMNYLQSMENIVESGISSGSIAVDASSIILQGLRTSVDYEDLIGGSGGTVDLILTEMAIVLNTDTPHSKQFAKFEVFRSLLETNKVALVERCCEAVSAFCRNHGADQSTLDKPDLFTLLQHARLVAYQCDSCALFPMKEIRYTLPEGNNDIE